MANTEWKLRREIEERIEKWLPGWSIDDVQNVYSRYKDPADYLPLETIDKVCSEQFLRAMRETVDQVINEALSDQIDNVLADEKAAAMIGETYDDPEGVWEITEATREHVAIRNIQKGNLNYGFEAVVPTKEAEYFLTHSYPWEDPIEEEEED